MARQIPLTRGMFAIVDDADFDWLNAFSWSGFADTNTFYVNAWHPEFKKVVRIHRLIMGFPSCKVDHQNGNGLDNRRSNLRLASDLGNARNARKRYGLSSKYKGVCWHVRDRAWRAQITVNYKKVSLGNFESEHIAALAYDNAARLAFGEFAALNFAVK